MGKYGPLRAKLNWKVISKMFNTYGLKLMGKQFQNYLSSRRKGWPCRRSGWGLTEEEERRVNAYCTDRLQSPHLCFGKNQRKTFPDNLVQKVIAGCKTHKWPPEDGSAKATYVICSHAPPLLNRILRRQPGRIISPSEMIIEHQSSQWHIEVVFWFRPGWIQIHLHNN